MTCAHVVHVALKKVTGVDSVEVSLNENVANVKLKPGNKVTVPQLWQIIHSAGYTPKSTTVVIRGELTGKAQLKVLETGETIALTGDPKKAAGQSIEIHGVMNPGKDFKQPVPIQIKEVSP